MRAPFDRIPAPDRNRTLAFLVASALVMLGLLNVLDAPLKGDGAPMGIVSLQLAFDAATARSIVDGWDDDQRLLCAFGLGLDYLFMFLYPAAVAAACVFFGERLRFRGSTLGRLGPVFAWVAVCAGVADMIENALLLGVLRGVVDVAGAASAAAVTKFALLLAALLYAVTTALALRLSRAAA